MTITILGAGISGLVLSRCLLTRGIASVLLEKSSQTTFSKRNNYGITLHRKTYLPLIKALNLDEGTFVKKVGIPGSSSTNEGDLRVHRGRFENFLAEGVDVQFEREVQSLSSRDDGVGIVLKNGETIQSDVVVGGDGVHSVVRKTVAPEVEFEILPFVAINGKRRIPLGEFEGLGFGGRNVVEQRVEDALFQVSISEIREKDVGVSYTYSRPARGQGDEVFRPGRENSAAQDIPEGIFGEVERCRGELEGPLKAVFETGRMRGERLLSWLMRVVEVDERKLVEAAEKGIVLMGDAVHAEPILGGEGANLAIEDGMRLAELIAEGKPLSHFYQERQDVWARSRKESKARISAMHGVTKPSL